MAVIHRLDKCNILLGPLRGGRYTYTLGSNTSTTNRKPVAATPGLKWFVTNRIKWSGFAGNSCTKE